MVVNCRRCISVDVEAPRLINPCISIINTTRMLAVNDKSHAIIISRRCLLVPQLQSNATWSSLRLQEVADEAEIISNTVCEKHKAVTTNLKLVASTVKSMSGLDLVANPDMLRVKHRDLTSQMMQIESIVREGDEDGSDESDEQSSTRMAKLYEQVEGAVYNALVSSVVRTLLQLKFAEPTFDFVDGDLVSHVPAPSIYEIFECIALPRWRRGTCESLSGEDYTMRRAIEANVVIAKIVEDVTAKHESLGGYNHGWSGRNSRALPLIV